MAQAVLRVEGLPEAPLHAAAAYYARYLPEARRALEGAEALVLIFSPADHSHRAWRLAAVQELAREAAPARVNALVGDDDAGLAEAGAFLAAAPGVTGQILAVDGKYAGNRYGGGR